MKEINTFIKNIDKLKFGNYILFQEYIHEKISEPILAIYLGCFVADQTLGFDYVKWNNENRENIVKIECHIEWMDYIDILGHWKNKPNWKQIIKKYRKQKYPLNKLRKLKLNKMKKEKDAL